MTDGIPSRPEAPPVELSHPKSRGALRSGGQGGKPLVRFTFEARYRSWTAGEPAPVVSPLIFGPDGVVMGCLEFEFVKAGRARTHERNRWDRVVPTKVRNLVVARWMLGRLDRQSDTLVHEGVDDRGDPAKLAWLLEAKTVGLAPGMPSEAPEEDDGTLGAGVRLRLTPSSRSGAAWPERAAEAGQRVSRAGVHAGVNGRGPWRR